MGKRYDQITPAFERFIADQHIFFVATAAPEGRVNTSPKGMDTLRVLGPNRIAWLQVTGSGNETAAHLAVAPRITLMWCAFEGHPRILRAYGTGRVLHRHDEGWDDLIGHFDERPGTRQIVDCAIDLVQTSCGMAVPYFDHVGDRDDLDRWAEAKGADGLAAYWQQKNTTSLDGAPITLPT
ncbi:pyridoxamine 5'-phosphate oxidase family protein [Euzebya sp.]|uniref:pyridoxamine 5'-phosphate oxidase family protein n=1 Tax=Euzebya sp. TaxID=1971409 RepID=UPI00351685CE